MTDLILQSNKTSQLLNSLIDTEVADWSYELAPSAPLVARQYVKLSPENSSSSAIDGREITFKLNRSQLLTNLYLRTQFSTTAGIYGNKLVAMSNQARSEVAAAKETATNADLISQVISKNN